MVVLTLVLPRVSVVIVVVLSSVRRLPLADSLLLSSSFISSWNIARLEATLSLHAGVLVYCIFIGCILEAFDLAANFSNII